VPFRFWSLACLAALCLLAPPSVAQRGAQDALSTLLSSGTMTSALPSEFAQEGALDPDRYVVGPGDVFAVSIGGAAPLQVQVPVTADGLLVLPDVGAVDVAGLTLRQARRRVVDALQPLYRNVSVAAALAQPRRFVVHVGGAVDEPGRRVVGPVARLSDAIAAPLPAAASAQPPSLQPINPLAAPTVPAALTGAQPDATALDGRFAPNLRAVKLHRAGEAPRSYDLTRYRRTGNPDLNPYLRDGDRIVVPAYHTTRDVAFVSGDVPFPGAYPSRPDDTAADLVAVAGGTHAGSVRVSGAGGASGSGQPVPAGATVYVEAERGVGVVDVEGEVAFPGAYRIVPGQTTARELLEQAGGVLGTALTSSVYIRRDRQDEQTAAQRALSAPGGLSFVARSSLAGQAAVADVSVPAVTWLGGASDVPLYDGDVLVVPRDEQTVQVLGGVARPGYLPFVAGASAAAYLERAGGLRRDVRDVLVLRSGTRELVDAGEVEALASGDLILAVTEDPSAQPELYALSLQQRSFELQERNARREARFRTISTATSVVGAVATLVTTYLIIRDR
jgi:protein involved in polysaccharide export with SLBB domain